MSLKYSDLFTIKYVMGVNDADKIDSNIWLGNCLASMSKEFMKNFDVVVNCTVTEPFYFDTKYKYRINIHDDKKIDSIEDMKLAIPKIIEKIDYHVEKNHKIYIHCYAGMQRSAILVVAYLMKKHDIEKDEAIKKLKIKRPITFTPRINFYDSI